MAGWQLAAATAALTCAIAAAVLARELSRVGVHQVTRRAQPIAFSHKLHAGDFRVPCLYCHFGARTSRHAGIPPANVCMNCHWPSAEADGRSRDAERTGRAARPVAWMKVHNLPDFVYFNHSQHVARASSARRATATSSGWCALSSRRR